MTLPLLLGEAPSKSGDRFHSFPLSGRPARVLCEVAGIPPQPDGSTYGRWTWALYERFDCRNVFERYADATPWSAPRAREAVRPLLAELRGDADGASVIVCLGRRVQKAVFGALDGDVALVTSRPGAWDTGFFGDFGVWAAPHNIYTPTACPNPHCRHGWVPFEPNPSGAAPPVPCRAHPVRKWAPWVVTLPHPSGLNRLLNDPAQRERCGEVLRRAIALTSDHATVAAR